MGRAQVAKGSKKGHLRIGRNSACRANAVEIDHSARVATLKYTKNPAAAPRLQANK
jgi:hypothetical protein